MILSSPLTDNHFPLALLSIHSSQCPASAVEILVWKLTRFSGDSSNVCVPAKILSLWLDCGPADRDWATVKSLPLPGTVATALQTNQIWHVCAKKSVLRVKLITAFGSDHNSLCRQNSTAVFTQTHKHVTNLCPALSLTAFSHCNSRASLNKKTSSYFSARSTAAHQNLWLCQNSISLEKQRWPQSPGLFCKHLPRLISQKSEIIFSVRNLLNVNPPAWHGNRGFFFPHNRITCLNEGLIETGYVDVFNG